MSTTARPGRRLVLLAGAYAVCRLPPGSPIPPAASSAELFSVTRTPSELSIVCPEELVPAGAECEPGWRCLKVKGPLAFSLTGILAGLTAPLAAAGIPAFALSTYDTDYLLVKARDLAAAMRALARERYGVERGPGT